MKKLINKVKSKIWLNKARCNICGSTAFELGPNNRKSLNGKLPKCTQCNSVERHRIVRGVFNSIPRKLLSESKVLQFSYDPSVEKNWFSTYEISIYGKNNSLDLENINRPNSSYDIILCNHVLEHVRDDNKAFSELIRILSPKGFLEVTVPLPMVVDKTDDWGYPDIQKFEHYRIYGKDVAERFHNSVSGIYFMQINAFDPVTLEEDVVYFFSKCMDIIIYLKKSLNKKFTINKI